MTTTTSCYVRGHSDGGHQGIAILSPGKERNAIPAYSREQALLNVHDSLAGRLPWEADVIAADRVITTLREAVRGLEMRAPREEDPTCQLMGLLGGVVTSVHHIGDFRSDDPPLRNDLTMVGKAAIRYVARGRYAALRDAVAGLASAAAQIDRLTAASRAEALRRHAIWPSLIADLHVAAESVLVWCFTMSAGIGDLTMNAGAINVGFKTDTPAAWPNDMADRFVRDPEVQEAFLNCMAVRIGRKEEIDARIAADLMAARAARNAA